MERITVEQVLTIYKYRAFDGTEFDNPDDCLKYEAELRLKNDIIKHVYLFLDEGINGKEIYACHFFGDFTNISKYLGLTRNNQELQGSDLSFKSITSEFNRYPFVIIYDPVRMTFKMQTEAKFREMWELDLILEKISSLDNLLVTPDENPYEGDDNTKDPEDPTDPTEPGGDDNTENPGSEETPTTGESTEGGDGEETTSTTEGDYTT